MSIDQKLKSLRILSRKNFKTIINHIIDNDISRKTNKIKENHQEICMFCGSTKDLTKEHVIPRWTFEGCTKKFFITDINKQSQTYNKTTISACSECNNERLSALEVYIKNVFSEINLETSFFSTFELENIIRWLEIIDYKFQVLNARRLFLCSKEHEYIPYLADFPLTVLRHNIDYSPSKAITEIRRVFKRVTIKDKTRNINSLLIFKTKNKHFYFFHTMDDFIFIELPQYKIALFYFYKKYFKANSIAKKKAMKIIKKVY